MVPLALIITTCLIHLTWSYNEELYPLSDPDSSYLYPEDVPDETEFEIHRRNNNNFLRFGRSGRKYDSEYEDYNEDFARPTRSGKIDKNNDFFIRFGRSKQDFLRFGRDQERPVRAKNEFHLRFGRSMEGSQDRRRSKRDTYPEYKRAGSNFLRFGRNSNFLRFGRNNEMAATADPEKQESPLIVLLTELVATLKKEQKKNNRSV